MPDPATHRLTKEQRDEITRRVMAGEKATALGKEFGVTRAYVALLKAQALDPERFSARLRRNSRANSPRPSCRSLRGPSPTTRRKIWDSSREEKWSLEHGHQLAWNLFQKKVSVRLVTDCATPHMPETWRFPLHQTPTAEETSRQPDRSRTGEDPDYVAYYLSPICEQIAWREYELALADWEARFARDEEREMADPADSKTERLQAPGHASASTRKAKAARSLRRNAGRNAANLCRTRQIIDAAASMICSTDKKRAIRTPHSWRVVWAFHGGRRMRVFRVMKAIAIESPRKMGFTELPLPSPGPDEVLLRVAVIGYCGTDLNIYRGLTPLASFPRVPGHEIGATIEKCGDQVPAEWKPGMAVTCSPYTTCGTCASCRQGRFNACEFNQTSGVQREGALTEFIVVPWQSCFSRRD